MSSHADTIRRTELKYHNEVAERGGDEVAGRLVGKWLAGVTYDEWREQVAENQRLRDALTFIEDDSLAFHKGEDGKARAIAVMGRTARAALDGTPADA